MDAPLWKRISPADKMNASSNIKNVLHSAHGYRVMSESAMELVYRPDRHVSLKNWNFCK